MPTSDGISNEDWDEVKRLAAEIANNVLAEKDDSSLKSEMLEYIDKLEHKYGKLPCILSTRADYIDDIEKSIALLNEAYLIACQLNDISNKAMISGSLAELYFEDVGDCEKTKYWLGFLRKDNDIFRDSDLEKLYTELKDQIVKGSGLQ